MYNYNSQFSHNEHFHKYTCEYMFFFLILKISSNSKIYSTQPLFKIHKEYNLQCNYLKYFNNHNLAQKKDPQFPNQIEWLTWKAFQFKIKHF